MRTAKTIEARCVVLSGLAAGLWLAASACNGTVAQGDGGPAGQDRAIGADGAPGSDAPVGTDRRAPDGAPLPPPDLAADAARPDGSAPDGVPPPDGGPGPGGPARQLAERLGKTTFLVGMGNDGTNDGNDTAYTLGPPFDLHYHYLVGVSSMGGWPTWNSPPGQYATKRIDEARTNSQVPMFTSYAMASLGDGNLGALDDAGFLSQVIADHKLLMQKVAESGQAVVLHLEPDFWGYAQQRAQQLGSPSQLAVNLGGIADCTGQPADITGFGRCLISIARSVGGQNAIVGLHASGFASGMDVGGNTNPDLDIEAEADKTISFLMAVGGGETDFVGIDPLDRDAGCWESSSTPECPGGRGAVFWDASNTTLPNFRQHLRWVTRLTAGLGKPALWWQVPFGVPTADGSPGTPGHWRDNRVDYFFAHIDELVAAGGVGVVFGTGAGGQTFPGPAPDGDGDNFKNRATDYFAAPFTLP